MIEIFPNNENGSQAEIDEAMQSSPDRKTYIRLHAIKLLIFGYAKDEVALIEGVALRSIQKWIKRWNYGGVDAMKTVLHSPKPTKIPLERHQELCDLLRDPEKSGQTHWTIKKLHGHIEKLLHIKLGYSTLTRFFRQKGFRLKVPRSWPYEQDEELREAFREKLGDWLADTSLEVWFADETGITGDPRPRRRWAHKSDRPRIPYRGTHIRENVIGAVHPRSGQFVSIIMTGVNKEVFQVFLDELASQTIGRNILLIMDNASWHKAKSLKWHNIIPEYLPAYSPDLNPIEVLWLYLKEHYFKDWIAKTREELENRMVRVIRMMNDNCR
ncbi:MAG: IS630 family transposase [Candidatus Hatepunaea meridiana]|nr:IS630 family transposase [Candidatus Hatepunaea meridiana]